MKTFVIAIFLLAACFSLPAQVKIGDNPDAINPSAILQLEKANKGFLITRVTLTGATDNTTIPDPAHGLLIYNTSHTGSGPDSVYSGFYCYDTLDDRWHRLLTSIHPSAGEIWIDANNNIISSNSQNQYHTGKDNVILGTGAFADDLGPSSNVIAIGTYAAVNDTTPGEAHVIAMGYNCAHNNGGSHLNAMGLESSYNNAGNHVNALGQYAAYANSGDMVNAIGPNAAASNTAVNVNALGSGPGTNNTGTSLNALGMETGYNNAGSEVNAMGSYAGYNNQSGNVNAFGNSAAFSNTGDQLNALGVESARNNTGANLNAMGYQSGIDNSGTSVNFLGEQAGQHNTANDVNGFGSRAAGNNQMANLNAFGLEAAENNTGESVNAFGFWSARNNSGSDINAFGYRTAHDNNGNHIVAIGEMALQGSDTTAEGDGNIAIGYHAAKDQKTGANNVAIGYDVHLPDNNGSNQINIADQIIRDENGVIRMKDLIRLTPLAVPPGVAEEGMIYFDSAMHALRVYDGTVWKTIAWVP